MTFVEKKKLTGVIGRSRSRNKVLAMTRRVLLVFTGAVNVDKCSGSWLLPICLVTNGVLWMLPSGIFCLINCLRKSDDIDSLLCCMEKLFFLGFAFIAACRSPCTQSQSQSHSQSTQMFIFMHALRYCQIIEEIFLVKEAGVGRNRNLRNSHRHQKII